MVCIVIDFNSAEGLETEVEACRLNMYSSSSFASSSTSSSTDIHIDFTDNADTLGVFQSDAHVLSVS